jgi:hypothetical protein
MSKEISFPWKLVDSSSLGNILRPIALVECRAQSGEWKTFYPEVDSGSPISVFNASDCELLGYMLDNGRPFKLTGVFGDSRRAYIHDIETKIGEDVTTSRIAFTEGENHKQLLGRIDIFDKFRICLRGKVSQTSFLKE